MKHSPGFLRIVEDAKTRIRELTVDDVKAMLGRGERFHLVDVREESEWDKGHLPTAKHLCKGIIERDVEEAIPDHAAKNLQKMGYGDVYSMDGGWRVWNERGFETEKG
jgi:rhodanese-related sulfurtransferase